MEGVGWNKWSIDMISIVYMCDIVKNKDLKIFLLGEMLSLVKCLVFFFSEIVISDHPFNSSYSYSFLIS